MTLDRAEVLCRNCDELLHWSLDHRRWVHDLARNRYCVKNFTVDHEPTTEAEPNG